MPAIDRSGEARGGLVGAEHVETIAAMNRHDARAVARDWSDHVANRTTRR